MANDKRHYQIEAIKSSAPSYSKKEREDYNNRREHTSRELGIDKNAYNAYRRHAHALSDADTNYANGTRGHRNYYAEPKYEGNKITNEYTEEHHKADTEPIHKKLKEMTAKHKLHYYHQSDPRGASLHLGKEKLDEKNYYSKGHAIY